MPARESDLTLASVALQRYVVPMKPVRRFERRATVTSGPRAVRPPRGWTFPQGVCVLLDAPTAIARIAPHLAGFDVSKETPGAPGPFGWALGGPSLILPYRPEVNGFVQVDVVSQPWPDAMGAPNDDTAPLFAAWAMGHFGPSTFPGALERAIQRVRAPMILEAATRHRAFLRVRLSYVFGASPDAPVHPSDRDPIDELRFVTQVQHALLDAPGATCGFNPNGELLLLKERLATVLDRDFAGEGLGVDAWANVRLFRPRDLGGDWLLFDTVGMEQVGVTDHEAALPFEHPSADHVPGLLYSMAAYDAGLGGVLGPADTATDAGGIMWRAHASGDAIVPPPRTALRWAPQGVDVPAALAGPS